MNAESLAQVEQIITTAVTGVEGRLRNEMQLLGASFRQEAAENFEEAERHSGGLYEDVLHKLDLVVEGHQALDRKIEKLEAGMEHEFLETRSLIQLSYRQLQDRVETLAQRVQTRRPSRPEIVQV